MVFAFTKPYFASSLKKQKQKRLFVSPSLFSQQVWGVLQKKRSLASIGTVLATTLLWELTERKDINWFANSSVRENLRSFSLATGSLTSVIGSREPAEQHQ